MTNKIDRIAVLAGDGNLPVILANRLNEINLISLIIVLQGRLDRFDPMQVKTLGVAPGEVEKIHSLLIKHRINKVIMIGKIDKRSFIERKGFDTKALLLSQALKDGRDLSIFHRILEEFNRIGIEVLPQDMYLNDIFSDEGLLTGRNPRQEELEDAVFGMEYAKKLATMEIGQTVVVKNKTILAIEAIEGTDETIRRGGDYGKTGTVVCKAARINQDRRFDIPTIGTETIEVMSEHGCSLLALEAGKIFIACRDEVIDLANKRGISILGV
jgi:DUF1009 family protein